MVLHPKSSSKKDRELKLKGALARIKALNSISASENDKPQKSVIIKGNKLSQGASLSADAKESAEASYLDTLRTRLQENWELPVWISRQNMSAQVQVFIDSRGRVRSYRFIKASGNAQFDSAIKKTLEESQPFPSPPLDIASALLGDGILIGFPL